MIKTQNLSFEYEQGIPILNSIDMSIQENEKVGIIGANGAGKSTLLKIFVGLLDKYHGDVKVLGHSVEKKNYAKIREQVSYMFQDSDNQLFMPTALEDIEFALRNYKKSEQEIKQSVDYAIKATGCADLINKSVWKMSGGEKKLVCIATMLATKPKIMLLDEPTNSLDPFNRKNLIDIIKSLNSTVVIASHDLDMILDTCDRVILMNNGKIIATGDSMEILSNRELLENNRLLLPISLTKKSEL